MDLVVGGLGGEVGSPMERVVGGLGGELGSPIDPVVFGGGGGITAGLACASIITARIVPPCRLRPPMPGQSARATPAKRVGRFSRKALPLLGHDAPKSASLRAGLLARRLRQYLD